MLFSRMPGRHCVVRWAIAVAGVICLPAVALAASQPDTEAPVAIRQALQASWQHHPSFRATEAQLAAARARLDAAGQPLYNPELAFDADDEGPDRTATLGVNLTLDLSGKRRVRQDAAGAKVDQATAEAKLRRRDFAKQWFASLANLQGAQLRVATGERRLQLVERFAGLAEKQFNADDISGLERDLALLARDEAEAEQTQLLAERAEARARFRGVGGNAEFITALTLPSDGLPVAITELPDIKQLPEWQAAQASALAAEREVLVAQRNRVADPTVGVRGGRIDYGNVQDDVIGVSLSIPLFVRNSYRAEVVAAQADAQVAQADAERLAIELDAERRRAVDNYASTRTAWTRWRASRGTDIQRRSDLLEKLWREGELSTTDYLQQLNQTLDTALAGAELEARLWRNYADYLAATGQLERWAGLDATP